MSSLLSIDDLRKERRRFEEWLRQALLTLEKREKYDEAEHLLFRLLQKGEELMALFLQ